MAVRKVLISPGFGAGWSTWNQGLPELRDDLLFDPILIEFVERCEQEEKREEMPDAIEAFIERMKVKHGYEDDAYICVLGSRELVVREVEGPFIVEEYDGFESLRLRDKEDWI